MRHVEVAAHDPRDTAADEEICTYMYFLAPEREGGRGDRASFREVQQVSWLRDTFKFRFSGQK
jgi:hypothetical protein